PAVLSADNAGLQAVVQSGASPVASLGSLHADPVAGSNISRSGSSRVQLHFWMERAAAQARQAAGLTLAGLVVLCAREGERIPLGVLRLRDRPYEGLLVDRKRRVAMLREQIGEDLDSACRRRKALRHAVLQLGELSITWLERYPYSSRVLAEGFERHAGGPELVAIRCVDIAVPEVRA